MLIIIKMLHFSFMDIIWTLAEVCFFPNCISGSLFCIQTTCNKISFLSCRISVYWWGLCHSISHSHGKEEATSSHSRNGSEDPGLPRAEKSAAGVAEVRPGLWDDEAASHREDAACVSLAGCPQRKPPLLPTGWHEDVRSREHLHPQVMAGGPHGAQLLADYQGQSGLHSWGETSHIQF